MFDSAKAQLAANTVRMLSADAVQKAKSGHPGMPLGCADFAVTLWSKYLRVNPKNPAWIGRDRFVLSAGHGSMLLYFASGAARRRAIRNTGTPTALM